MLSLTQFRQNCYIVFNLLISSRAELEVVHKGKVYVITVRETNRIPMLARQGRRKPQKLQNLSAEACNACTSVIVNGICMNNKCVNADGVVENPEMRKITSQ